MPESTFHLGTRAVGKGSREGRETGQRECSRPTPIAPWAAPGGVTVRLALPPNEEGAFQTGKKELKTGSNTWIRITFIKACCTGTDTAHRHYKGNLTQTRIPTKEQVYLCTLIQVRKTQIWELN